MELSELKSVINTSSRQKAYARILSDEKMRRISLDGLEGSSVAFALLNLLQLPQASFIVANDSDEAGYLFHDIEQIEHGEHVAFSLRGISVILSMARLMLRRVSCVPMC